MGKIREKLHRDNLLAKSKEELVDILDRQDNEIAFLNSTVREWMTKSIFLVDQLKVLQKQLEEKTSVGLKYNPSWSWVSKIVYALKESKKPLRTSQVVEFLAKQDSKLEKWFSTMFLSPHMVKGAKYKRIIKYKINGIIGYYYLLPEWIDENRKLKNEYAEKMDVIL